MYIPERIKEKVSQLIKNCTEDSCLEWEGSLTTTGYPDINTTLNGRKYHGLVHRIAYQIFTGEDIQTEDFICHRCDNPKCYNPYHLFRGTHQDNMDDMVRKGRSCKGEKNSHYIDGRNSLPHIPKPHTHGRKLNAEQVHNIKELRKEGHKLREISELLNVSLSTIKDICSGRAYSTFE